ncbi:MAG TPA: permease-like cell division protein FtsX [Luteitalea sp.]|nr:permease-like cell division protein FtsX [Luteitalea sp.]
MSTRRREDANPTGFLRYCFEEATTALVRRWRVAALSTLLLAAAVFVVGAALAVSATLRDVTARMTQAAELSVYLSRDASTVQRTAAAEATRRDPAVATVDVLDEAAATERVLGDFPDLAGVINALPERPFGSVIEARLAPTATEGQVEALVTRLRAVEGVDDVSYDREVLRRILLTVTTVRRAVAGIAVLLGLAAFGAVAAVLRLGYYARRQEIEVLGLLGAPSRAIAGPFVAEGLLQAALATAVGLIALRLAVWAVVRGPAAAWARAFELPSAPFVTWEQMLTLAVATLAAGGLAGWVGSRELPS